MLLLRMGKIDDADEVFVNGRWIGFTGQFPPDFQTAYGQERVYEVPSWLLRTDGDNVVSTRSRPLEASTGATTASIRSSHCASSTMPCPPEKKVGDGPLFSGL